jgi:hypothetical protein
MRCPFCYEEGDPQNASVLNEPAGMATLQEIETRLRYRDPGKGTGLFQPLTYINEMFCNPQVLEILDRLRSEMRPEEVFTFVSNGTYFTDDVVQRLTRLRPIFFNFSVNSLDPEIRRRILRDREPETAIRAIELLGQNRIPYLGSLVCWPTIPWADIERTVRELDRAGCAVIRFSLSAYSKHLKGTRYDRLGFWTQGLALARRLQRELATPIKVEPYYFDRPSFRPHLVGTIAGSPAAREGLRAGDLLTRVAGQPVPTANHALTALAAASAAGPAVTVALRAGGTGDEREVVLDLGGGPFGYPFDQMTRFKGFEWGLILVENLRFSYLRDLREAIDRRGAKVVLVCSSELMRPIVTEMLETSAAFRDVDIRLEVPPNRFFGGTVVLGDLLVVDDYVEFIQEYARRSDLPIDLVAIPSSPFTVGGWKRDLAGKAFTEIERRVRLPVEMIQCRPLNG